MSLHRKATTVLCALSQLVLAGCAHVPSGRLVVDRMDYGQVIAESWKRQTLLNVVRLRYADAPVFLDVTSVINTYSLAGNVSAGASVNNSQTLGDSVQIGAGGSWSNTPTVTCQPLMGDRFTKWLLQPIPPAAVFQLMQGGWPTDLVMRTAVKSVNEVRNDSFGIGGDPGFRELIETLTKLQRAGGLGNRIEVRKDGSAVILVLGERGGAEAQDVRRVRELLRLDEGLTEIEVVYGLAPRSGREVAMVTRSMLEIILELGLGIDLPAGTSRALPGRGQPGDVQPTLLVRIRSGTAVPADAFVAVPYKGQSYWIDDTDVGSKRTFTFLMILFSLAETGLAPAAPVVTVPTR